MRAVAILVPASAPLVSRAAVPALIGAAGALALSLIVERRRPSLPSLGLCSGVLLLLAWAGLSNAWALAPAWRPLAGTAGLMVAGLLLIAWAPRAGNAELMANRLILGVAIGLLVYAFEAISGGWLTRVVHALSWRDIINDETGGISIRAFLINGTVILSLFLWPAAGALVRRGQQLIALLLVALVIAATAGSGSDSGLIALAAGALAWMAAAWLGAHAARIAAALFVVVVLVMPYAAHRMLAPLDVERFAIATPELPSSAIVRLFIWKFTAERITERPFLGWGFDAARRIPGGGESFVLHTADGRPLLKDLYLPLHPHSQVLQIWLELGLVGAVIAAATGAFIIWRTGARSPPARNTALALIATITVYDLLSFGAWQSWWIAAVLLVAALHSSLNEGTRARP